MSTTPNKVSLRYINKIIDDNNLKLKDAKKNVIVTIKKCDIQTADRKAPQHCAFANACKRQIKGLKRAIFVRTKAYLQINRYLIRYHLLESVQKEIAIFDRGGQMHEGEFTLRAPHPSKRLGAHKKNKKSGPRKTRQRLEPRFTAVIRSETF